MKKIIKTYKVILGLSGGVDSAVSAWILKILGYNIKCVFIKSWENDDKKTFCNSKKDYKDCVKICKHLKIKLIKINFSNEYWYNVFLTFLNKLKKSKTPNPDILCNKKIKFDIFFKFAIKILKGDFLSTGHYVNKQRIKKNNYILLKGKDKKKDQSYFLHLINQKQLKKCIFPIGKFKKKTIRKIASNINLINSKKKDSTGICFIGKKNFFHFIGKYIKNKPGLILNTNNKILGKHPGLFFYTIGQRKNLNLGGGYKIPYYVIKKNLKKNTLIVAKGKNNKLLFSKGLFLKKIHFIYKKKIDIPFKCKIKTRYQQKELSCTLFAKKNIFKIIFKIPIFAVTPGQSAVFYIKNICLGGGEIYKSIPINKIQKNQ